MHGEYSTFDTFNKCYEMLLANTVTNGVLEAFAKLLANAVWKCVREAFARSVDESSP